MVGTSCSQWIQRLMKTKWCLSLSLTILFVALCCLFGFKEYGSCPKWGKKPILYRKRLDTVHVIYVYTCLPCTCLIHAWHACVFLCTLREYVGMFIIPFPFTKFPTMQLGYVCWYFMILLCDFAILSYCCFQTNCLDRWTRWLKHCRDLAWKEHWLFTRKV